jgi:hypothetical protein
MPYQAKPEGRQGGRDGGPIGHVEQRDDEQGNWSGGKIQEYRGTSDDAADSVANAAFAKVTEQHGRASKYHHRSGPTILHHLPAWFVGPVVDEPFRRSPMSVQCHRQYSEPRQDLPNSILAVPEFRVPADLAGTLQRAQQRREDHKPRESPHIPLATRIVGKFRSANKGGPPSRCLNQAGGQIIWSGQALRGLIYPYKLPCPARRGHSFPAGRGPLPES